MLNVPLFYTTLHKQIIELYSMEATIRINTDELGQNWIDAIKSMFPNRTVRISVEPEPADDTEFILSRPEYAAELLRRMEEYEQTKKTITVNPSDLL